MSSGPQTYQSLPEVSGIFTVGLCLDFPGGCVPVGEAKPTGHINFCSPYCSTPEAVNSFVNILLLVISQVLFNLYTMKLKQAIKG